MAFQRDKYLWLFFILTIILSGVFAFVNLFEYVNIVILKRTEGYPFGRDGVAWFYQTKELYTTICLAFGIVFFIALPVSLWSLIKAKKKLMLVTLITTIVLVIFQIINGQAI